MSRDKWDVKLDSFLMDDPSKPYDFVKEKTPEEQFREQIKKMDKETVMDSVLDINELRKKRRKKNANSN